MRVLGKHTSLTSKIIGIIFIVLFVYTASTKIRDFEIFQLRLSQSPLIEGAGDWVAVGIIVALLVTSGLLMFQRSRKAGLIATLGLMVVFTTYIAVVLGFFSSTLPCSCNGVFESMTWNQHLWFNIGFLVLAVIGVLSAKEPNPYEERYEVSVETKT